MQGARQDMGDEQTAQPSPPSRPEARESAGVARGLREPEQQRPQLSSSDEISTTESLHGLTSDGSTVLSTATSVRNSVDWGGGPCEVSAADCSETKRDSKRMSVEDSMLMRVENSIKELRFWQWVCLMLWAFSLIVFMGGK